MGLSRCFVHLHRFEDFRISRIVQILDGEAKQRASTAQELATTQKRFLTISNVRGNAIGFRHDSTPLMIPRISQRRNTSLAGLVIINLKT